MNLLPLNLAKLSDAADKKGSSRFALSSVHLRLHGDNTFLAEATDTHQIIRVTGDCPYPADEYPAHPGLAAAPNGGIEALIPLDAWHFREKSELQHQVDELSEKLARFELAA